MLNLGWLILKIEVWKFEKKIVPKFLCLKSCKKSEQNKVKKSKMENSDDQQQ